MIKKLDYMKTAPAGMKALMEMDKYLRSETTLDAPLQELVKLRSSQINGCALCLDYHAKLAIKLGETKERIFLIGTWEETNIFTAREKVALDFTERVTLIPNYHMEEDMYVELSVHFTDKEIFDLMLLIGNINTWNRISILFNTHEV